MLEPDMNRYQLYSNIFKWFRKCYRCFDIDYQIMMVLHLEFEKIQGGKGISNSGLEKVSVKKLDNILKFKNENVLLKLM